jgi:hypothetical protein
MYFEAELDHPEAFVKLTVQQEDTTTHSVNGNNQDSSEIMALVLDHVNDDNDQHGGSMLDDHVLAREFQADLNGEGSLQDARLQVERCIPNTSTARAWNSESVLQADLDGDKTRGASVAPYHFELRESCSYPSPTRWRSSWGWGLSCFGSSYSAVIIPSRPCRSLVSAAVLYTAPHTFNTCSTSGRTFAELTRPLSDCSICLDGTCAFQEAVSLSVCGHELHKACIATALEFSKRCPVCRVGSEPQGGNADCRLEQ